jgi:hypothetical protein
MGFFRGDARSMRHHLRISKSAWASLTFPIVMLSAMIAGCDSTGDPSSPEAKAQIQATRDNIAKVDEKNNADLKKKNKNAPVVRNIKGALKPGGEEAK